MTHEELFQLSQKVAEEQFQNSINKMPVPEDMPIPKELMEYIVKQVYNISASVAAQVVFEYEKSKE